MTLSMSTPAKTPKPKAEQNSALLSRIQAIEQRTAMEDQNVESVWLWSRRCRSNGRDDLGHVVLIDLILGYITEARRLAKQGIRWVAPDETPETYEPRRDSACIATSKLNAP
jgi:hypothetical protein